MSYDIAYMDVKKNINKINKINKGGIGWVRKVTTFVVALNAAATAMLSCGGRQAGRRRSTVVVQYSMRAS